jgi:hypothetical protein
MMAEDEIYEAYFEALHAHVRAMRYVHQGFGNPDEISKLSYLTMNILFDFTRECPELSTYGYLKNIFAAWIVKDLWNNKSPELLREGCKIFDQYNKALHKSGVIVLRKGDINRLLKETTHAAEEIQHYLDILPDELDETPTL